MNDIAPVRICDGSKNMGIETVNLTDKMRLVIREAIKRRFRETIDHDPPVGWLDDTTCKTITEIERTGGREGLSLQIALIAIRIALESNVPAHPQERE